MKSWVVYFILDAGRAAVKIGITNNLDRRLFNLQLGNPAPLTVARSWDTCDDNKREAQLIETSLHYYGQKFALGREWFEAAVLKMKTAKSIRQCPIVCEYGHLRNDTSHYTIARVRTDRDGKPDIFYRCRRCYTARVRHWTLCKRVKTKTTFPQYMRNGESL